MKRFSSQEEVDKYISGDRLECLECGKTFILLPKHLASAHKMSVDAYREKYNIPSSVALAGVGYRDTHRQKMKRLQEEGVIDYSHLPRATKAAQGAGRGNRRDFSRERQAEIMKSVNDSGKAYRKAKKPA